MNDYSKWPEKLVAVTNLRLDGGNPRIPSNENELSQRDLVAELVEHDKVYDLAKDIAEQGYYPLESLVGIREGRASVVLEGNRRLAALKLLINPDLAPERYRARFAKLTSKTPVAATQKVRVLFAPARNDAAPLILRKHTREQIERWSPLMQARFYRSLLASGTSVDSMAREYGLSPGTITGFLRTDAMYTAACNLDLPESVQRVVQDPRKFPAAVLQRLVDIPKARSFLGVDFSKNGEIRGKVHPDEFRKGFARILSDIARRKIDTRTLNTVRDAEQYLSSIKADEPDKRRRGSFAGADLIPGRPARKSGTGSQGTAGKRAAAQGSSVVPPGTKCLIAEPRIRSIFKELRQLNLERYPNASAVLFRVLLEISLSHHLSSTGKDKGLSERARKNKKPSTWCPTLREMLKVVVEDPSIPLTRPQRKHVERMRNKDDSILTVEDLDSYVHGPFAEPTPAQLRAAWKSLGPLWEIVLDEPPAPNAPTPSRQK